MRASLCLAALAALCAMATAGPIRQTPGCFPTDTYPKYKIKGVKFVDVVKGSFVDMAYIQARKRAAQVAVPKWCVHTGHHPLHACYNSVIPGTKGIQIGGQYGFSLEVFYRCGKKVYSKHCKVRINSLRGNRPGAPDFWGPVNIKC